MKRVSECVEMLQVYVVSWIFEIFNPAIPQEISSLGWPGAHIQPNRDDPVWN